MSNWVISAEGLHPKASTVTKSETWVTICVFGCTMPVFAYTHANQGHQVNHGTAAVPCMYATALLHPQHKTHQSKSRLLVVIIIAPVWPQ